MKKFMDPSNKFEKKSMDYSYQSYTDYSSNLRVWFMAFGFGFWVTNICIG